VPRVPTLMAMHTRDSLYSQPCQTQLPCWLFGCSCLAPFWLQLAAAGNRSQLLALACRCLQKNLLPAICHPPKTHANTRTHQRPPPPRTTHTHHHHHHHVGVQYKSHHIGKWHVGFSTPSRTPHGRGFDTSLCYAWGLNDYLHGLSYYGCNGTTHDFAPGTVDWLAHPADVDRRCTIRSINGRHLSHYTDLWEAGEAGEGPAVGLNGTAFEESLFASRAVGIIESHDATSGPLFLYYAMHLLVSPLCAPLEYLDKFSFIDDNEDRRCVK
jgi:hypothetical protein